MGFLIFIIIYAIINCIFIVFRFTCCQILITKYKVYKIKKKIKKVYPKTNDDCIICLDDYYENNKCGELKCNHRFHINCIIKWLLIKPTCPLCVLDI